MNSKFYYPNLALLLVRLGLAFIFIEHSLQKLSAWKFSAIFFTRLHLPFPVFTLFLVCGVELLGGIAMLLGLWVEVFGILLALDMLGVIIFVRMGPMAHGILAGHEFELMLLIMSVAIALIGSGKYAIINREKSPGPFADPKMA